MRKKPEGVRERVAGKRYEISWRPYRGASRVFRNIEASSFSEASYKRQQVMAEYNKEFGVLSNDKERLSASFAEMLEAVKRNLSGDKRAKKTISEYGHTFWRLFRDFKEIYEKKHNVTIENLKQIDYSYFVEYKNYYTLDLNRASGWRAELIRMKSVMNHLRRLKHCDKQLVYDIREEFPTPAGNSRNYQNIPDSTLDKLFAYIRQDRSDYYKPIRFMYLTGRRETETTYYKKTDVERNGFEPIKLHIRAEITKTKTAGKIDLSGELARLIRESYHNNKSEWLFPNRHGRRCQTSGIYKYLCETSKQVIGIKFSPHYLRKNFHTKKIPISMHDAMAISGLKDVNVAMKHYSFSTPEGQAKILDKRGKAG